MRAAAAVSVLGALALVGCGPGGDLVERRPVIHEQASNAELGSSPGRTALAWWDSARARDTEALVARLTPAARRTIDLAKLREALSENFGRFAEGTEAHVLYTEREPGRATVYMRIDGGGLVGRVLVKGGGQMLALPFVESDGAWLIENAAWLRGQADSYIAIRDLNRKIRREALRQQALEEEEGK
ncbi:MAG: hypothetical protein H0T69_15345 [Thermoleophilaceae bacterium]|nr:hypothetical protein [Thermoleophilaceae bacterium]